MKDYRITIKNATSEVLMGYLGYDKEDGEWAYYTSNICEAHDRVKIAHDLGEEFRIQEYDCWAEDEEVYENFEDWKERYGEE